MEWQGWFSILLTCGSLVVLVATHVSPHVVMLGTLVILSVTGILTPVEALAGFANPGLITVACMFIVAAGIHSSGGIDIIVNSLLGRPSSERSAIARVFAPVVALSGFMNNTPVVATMIPGVLAWSRKINISPAKLMIPLSYASILGGTITLIGSSTNLVVNGQYQSLTGSEGFSLLSITVIGLPVAIIGGLFLYLFSPWLLPARKQKNVFSNLREFTLEVSVDPKGALVGKSIEEAGLRNLRRVFLVEIEREGSVISIVEPGEILKGDDRLVFAGDTEAITDLLRINGIKPSVNDETYSLEVERAERCLVEAVVSEHCEAIGHAIRDARFRARYGAVVLAVARNGERVKGNLGTTELEAGDTLLLEARPSFAENEKFSRDFLLISELDAQTPDHRRAYLSWVILGIMVGMAAADLVSMLNAALAGAAMMVVTGCCSVRQAERSLDFNVILTIAAAFALGAALLKTGVALYIADQLISLSGGKPWLMLVMTYFTLSILTEVITNNAAAILMLPVVLEATERAGLNQEPFVFAVMMAASASFATPIGYQTNLMVYGPGGYRFKDFLRAGLPMNIFIGAVTLGILILFWPLKV